MSRAALAQAFEKLTALNDTVTFDYVLYLDKWREMFADYPATLDCVNSISSLEDLRFLVRYNLFFFLVAICSKKHLLVKWTDDRCRDCSNAPYGQIQLWSRGHYKSSIWTFGRTILDILATHGKPSDKDILSNNIIDAVYKWRYGEKLSDDKLQDIKQHDIPEEATICLLSATASLAQSFLKQIMVELQTNGVLIALFPDILYENPSRNAACWGINTGITVKRNSNRSESTVEAWGLLNAQPTGKHFGKLNYDDIVTKEVAMSGVLNLKLIESLENSFNLCSHLRLFCAEGTRKTFNDPYSVMIERGVFKEVLYSPFDENGELVLLTREQLALLKQSLGEATFAAEILQKPLESSALGLKPENVVKLKIINTDNLSLYFFCDPSKGETKDSDYSVYGVFGVDAGGGLILIDGIRDRLLPTQKWEALYSLYKKYPKVKKIYYEEAGLCNDLAQFKERAIKANHPSFCSLLCKVTQSRNKNMRIISALEPLLEQRKFFVNEEIIRKTVEGDIYNLTHILLNDEMRKFPFSRYDDVLDICAEAAIKLEKGAIKGIIDAKPVIKQPILSNARGMNFESF